MGLKKSEQKKFREILYEFRITHKGSSVPFWFDLIFYMAFISVIKCPYKIWSYSEIIWAKKIRRRICRTQKLSSAQITLKGLKWILFLRTFNY